MEKKYRHIAANIGKPAPVQDDESGDVASGAELLNEYNLTQKEQWQSFKQSFTNTYPDFEKNIIAKIGSVSGAELRRMMLHKLGLSNKEIAQTLLISDAGVKKGKYRLYKRIGISSSKELSEFLH
jgi:AraC family transcriptional regulator, chitin signaling transcriptional activator